MRRPPEPCVPSCEDVEGQEPLMSFEDFDRVVLEACGYDVNGDRFRTIMENVVADDEGDRVFTVMNKTCSFDADGAVEQILKDETFDRYWRLSIYDRLTDEDDGLLLEQWTDDFIGEEVRKYLMGLKKLEKFYYIDFFRGVLSKSGNPDAVNLIDFNDPVFDDMPEVVRIY